MTALQKTVSRAISEHNYHLLRYCVEYMTRRMGMNHTNLREWFADRFDMDSATFDAYMYEIDSLTD